MAMKNRFVRLGLCMLAGWGLAALTAQLGQVPLEQADVVVALGGDGFMLQTLNETRDLDIPVDGMNCGTVGFLMNTYSIAHLARRLRAAEEAVINPLAVRAVSVDGTVTEALAVFLRPQGTPPSVGEGTAVALAPKGAMPGGMVATTSEVTARVVSVDAASRHVTLQLPDGRKRTVSVNPRINPTKVAPGNAVTVQVADALAISVERP
mgnify:CR=1 FL=1